MGLCMAPYCVQNREESTFQMYGRLRDVRSESGIVERLVCRRLVVIDLESGSANQTVDAHIKYRYVTSLSAGQRKDVVVSASY